MSLFGGKKSSTSTSSIEYPPWVEKRLKEVLGRADTLSDQPYEAYTGERLAGLNADELASFDIIRNLQGQGLGNYGYAQDTLRQVTDTGLNGFSQGQINQYMNPYIQNVLDVSKGRALDQFSQTMKDYNSRAGQIGSFGGSRVALGQQQLQDNFSRQLQESETLGLANAYENALSSVERGMARAGQGALGLAGLTDSAQGYGLRDAAALQSIGQQQRLQEQTGLDLDYQNYLEKKQYPYEQLQFLASMALPIAGASASQTSTSTEKGGGSGILGGVLGLGSMLAAPFTGGTSLLGGLGGFSSGLASGLTGLGFGNMANSLFNVAGTGALGAGRAGLPFAEGGAVPRNNGLEDFSIAMEEVQRAINRDQFRLQFGNSEENGPPTNWAGGLRSLWREAFYGTPESYNAAMSELNMEAKRKHNLLTSYAGMGSNNAEEIPYPINEASHPNSQVFNDVVSKAVSDFGAKEDEENLRKVMYLESSGNPEAKNGSYYGLFQIGDLAAKDVGMEDYRDPLNNAITGVKYWELNKQRLGKKLDRQPRGYELYLAHQQGANGAYKVISNPEGKAVDSIGRDKLEANGGHKDMTNADFLNLWKRKFTSAPAITLMPKKNFADGGLVGYLDSLRYTDNVNDPMWERWVGSLGNVANSVVGLPVRIGNKVYDNNTAMLGYLQNTEAQNKKRLNDIMQARETVARTGGLGPLQNYPQPPANDKPTSQKTADEQFQEVLDIATGKNNSGFRQPSVTNTPNSVVPQKEQGISAVKTQVGELTDGESSKPEKKGINFPLLAFGATLLASEDGFFQALGQAGMAYGNTTMAIQDKEDNRKAKAEAARQANLLAMLEIGQKDRSLDISQQKADSYAKQVNTTNSPYKLQLEQIKLQTAMAKLASLQDPRSKAIMKFIDAGIQGGMPPEMINAQVENALSLMSQYGTMAGGPPQDDPLVTSAENMGLTIQ